MVGGAIAMALAGKPRLLLLDEPTGGMSLEERRVTGELLQPIKSHCSLVIVEQDIAQALAAAKQVYCLQEGRVAFAGLARDATREAVAAAYFGV